MQAMSKPFIAGRRLAEALALRVSTDCNGEPGLTVPLGGAGLQ